MLPQKLVLESKNKLIASCIHFSDQELMSLSPKKSRSYPHGASAFPIFIIFKLITENVLNHF